MPERKDGFTLIELLVVIAIIAILAAILFPIFGIAREKGKIARCAANEKQMALAFQQYCDSYGSWPYQQWCLANPYSKYASPNWCKAIFMYTRNYAVLQCPSADYRGVSSMATSYYMNANVCGKRADICRHPTKTMVVFENWRGTDAAMIANVVGVIASNHGQFGMGKGDNFLFVDGHVKYYLVDEKQFRWRHYGDPFWDYNDTIRDY